MQLRTVATTAARAATLCCAALVAVMVMTLGANGSLAHAPERDVPDVRGFTRLVYVWRPA